MKLREEHKKLIVVMFFGLLSVATLATGSFIQQQRNISNSQATSGCFCNDQDKCYPDGCTRKPIKSDGSIDYGRCGQVGGNAPYGQAYDTSSVEVNRYFCLQQPPCCAEMLRRNDPEACCWPEKGYCYPTYCTPETKANNNCGWYWSFHAEQDATKNGYGCMIGDSPSTMQPIFGLPAIASSGNTPTSTPKPQATATPQPQPTSTVTPNQPTSTPAPIHSPIPTNQQPTNAANIEPSYNPPPTNPPLPTNAPYKFPPIEIKSPKELAREVINPENIQELNTKTAATLEVPRKGFNSIKAVDKKLETFTQSFFQKVWSKIINFIDR